MARNSRAMTTFGVNPRRWRGCRSGRCSALRFAAPRGVAEGLAHGTGAFAEFGSAVFRHLADKTGEAAGLLGIVARQLHQDSKNAERQQADCTDRHDP